MDDGKREGTNAAENAHERREESAHFAVRAAQQSGSREFAEKQRNYISAYHETQIQDAKRMC